MHARIRARLKVRERERRGKRKEENEKGDEMQRGARTERKYERAHMREMKE